MALSISRFRWSAALMALGAGLALGAVTQPAVACGGFFCSATPVDQTAERIIFSVNPDETTTAYVQIQYAGEKDNFAWIVPVPSAPVLGEFPQLVFNALDLATEPQYFSNQCFRGDVAFSGGAPTAGNAAEDGDPGVTVIAHQNVGPFETVTLEGDTAEVLIEWLQMNGYRITNQMEPFIQEYVDDGMMFLAMKLLPTAEVSDIKPISMTYQGSEPMIPIRLTTVAAQPEMGIKAWVFGSRRFGPKNYANLVIEDSSIQFDPLSYRNNYLTVVSRGVDQLGGQAFVTEYAQATAPLLATVEGQGVPANPDAIEANEALLDLLRTFPYLTRLYSRMSAEEMNEDPYFQPSDDQADVSNIHDLTPEEQTVDCTVEPPPLPPCAFTYCGRQGVCVRTVDGTDACACMAGEGSTARPTTTGAVASGGFAPTQGSIDVYCEPMTVNFSDPIEDMMSDTCSSFECGAHGECVLMNGNPTCRCESGYAATAQMIFDAATSTTRVSMACSEVDGAIPELPLLPRIGERVVRPEDMIATGNPSGTTGNSSTGSAPSANNGGGGCTLGSGGRAPSSSFGAIAALLGLATITWRRRQR